MSNALAIASVTAVLKDLLNNGVIDQNLAGVVGEVTVTALPPDRVLIEGQDEASQINIFLYQATPNLGWRSVGLPARDSGGARVSNPPLGLDLHYLISTYGASELHAEILLGYALQLLHETPVLTRDAIRTALAPPPPVSGATVLPPPYDALVASELADQVEQIRLTPVPLSLEEISKLWSAIQSHYRPTAAYLASVVLIESRRTARAALPVGDDGRRLYVTPFTHPRVDEVVNANGSRTISVDDTIEIRGQDLAGGVVRITIDGVTFAPTTMARERITLALSSPLPVGLHAGVKGVQVVQPRLLGDPATEHTGVTSNVGAFVLRPTITSGPIIPVSNVLGKTSSTVTVGSATISVRAGRLRLQCDPVVGRDQRVMLLLNQYNPPAGAIPRAYAFDAPVGNGIAGGTEESATIELPFAGVVPGTYVVRIQVDRAESLLAMSSGGTFASPRITIS